MRVPRPRFLAFIGLLCAQLGSNSAIVVAQVARPVVPSDCVTVRRLLNDDFRSSIALNPEGNAIAFLVQYPDIKTNQNEVTVNLKRIDGSNERPRSLFIGSDVKALQWIDHGKAIAFLARSGAHIVLETIDSASGRTQILTKTNEDIAEYSMSRDGTTLVFATELSDPFAEKQASAEELASGYQIPFEKQQSSTSYKRRLFIVRKDQQGHWGHPQSFSPQSPFTGEPMRAFSYALSLRMSLSPDGHSLVFTYMEHPSNLSERWRANSQVQAILSNIAWVLVTIVADLRSARGSLPFESPWAWSIPVWSPDGSSFIIAAKSPINSQWEQQDRARKLSVGDGVHMFQVDTTSNQVREVVSELDGFWKAPLAWNPDGTVIVQTATDTFSTYSLKEKGWDVESTMRIPQSDLSRGSQFAGDGGIIVGEQDAPAVPPQLFWYKAGEQSTHVLAKLNPQFDRLTLARAEHFEWKGSTGYPAKGLLFLPPDYSPSKRYPLVIQSYETAETFFCDSGASHYPTFAPQPIANAGMLYLIRIVTAGSLHDEEKFYSKGYPGHIAVEMFRTDLLDSAVKVLDEKAIVDPHKVGIVGFSRSGYDTEFALVHGKTQFAAASAADNAQYSLSEYMTSRSEGAQTSIDAMFGGNPYGSSLKNWVDYSISFNLAKIDTPLLMEEMGYGTKFENDQTPPMNLTHHWEVFAGLHHLNKPVELYYYPFEGHEPEHPKARLGSLQRNLDWYRFWLQGYKDPAPDKRDQYDRWDKLRQLHASDLGTNAQR